MKETVIAHKTLVAQSEGKITFEGIKEFWKNFTCLYVSNTFQR